MEDLNQLSEKIISACIEVHRHLGPGLFEHIYADCLEIKFLQRSLGFEREKPININYKNHQITNAFRADFLIESRVILEIKSLAKIEDIHKSQVITYLRLGGFPLGLLINFNTSLLVKGISRIIAPNTPSIDSSSL